MIFFFSPLGRARFCRQEPTSPLPSGDNPVFQDSKNQERWAYGFNSWWAITLLTTLSPYHQL